MFVLGDDVKNPPTSGHHKQILAEELRRERRCGFVLLILGFIVLAFLVVYFVYVIHSEVPTVPVVVTSTPKKPVVTDQTIGFKQPEEAQVPLESSVSTSNDERTMLPKPAVLVPESNTVSVKQGEFRSAEVEMVFSKAATLWIDGKLSGKNVKSHNATLSFGKHTIKVALGKRTVSHPIEVEEGKNYQVRDDGKRLWIQVAPLK